ncbi:dnaJ homolog subfamily C member 1 [Neocloeon triangulifer]|uniref:dnaJ homolog subfamily C member 1 n=1 Tax=Neocloeon triangulifer TaxID=2078957 RepID=UPI00286F5EED|nr:dnaJ homolog subfamily C member 1 [Neocloeon triangulifer]XP_059485099.1 dnaJ homolog subfamily C member 1 [Neocloeon triangulifer]XP_059485100.1 dnaJ homolog subfamily C member 1 [Neocloeon triangulifer]XP_059485101.1 dnaJ homolog subfamily C member 1 [Neocloeon triangulifer]
MKIHCYFLLAALGLCFAPEVGAWGTDEMELFDLVEEVNTNFYTMLGVSQDADTKEIKKAFRRLSLVLHPDKNDAPDAEVKFRQLVGVYEVLTNPERRQRYHEVLEFGLPDWRSAVYYYRRARKMGLLEMTVILFMTLTIGHYAVLWAAYAEKKYTIEQNLNAKNKKTNKKVKKGNSPEEELDWEEFGLEKPTLYKLLPIQTVKFVYFVVTGLPQLCRFINELWEERKRRKLEEEELANEESSEEEEPKEKKPRKRKTFQPPEVTYDEGEYPQPEMPNGAAPVEVKKPSRPPPVVGGLWTDDDFAELAKLCKKHPGGTPSRWEKIAECMNRTVPEVTHMAKKVIEDLSKYTVVEEEPTPEVEAVPKKVKTKGGKLGSAEESGADSGKWSQQQQKALEAALAKFPKGTSERWVKIAKCVPEKTMEECMARFKYLAEMIKKKKASQDTDGQDDQHKDNEESVDVQQE